MAASLLLPGPESTGRAGCAGCEPHPKPKADLEYPSWDSGPDKPPGPSGCKDRAGPCEALFVDGEETWECSNHKSFHFLFKFVFWSLFILWVFI